jgi:hypothetical protein
LEHEEGDIMPTVNELINSPTTKIDGDKASLLAHCADLINQHGPDSEEVVNFITAHESDHEFVELAEFSRSLKQAFIETGLVQKR